jgi:uncharacterized repeat protein (TIGR03803 family)
MTSRIEYPSRISGKGWRVVSISLALWTVLVLAAIAARAQNAPSYTVLHAFSGADGEFPLAAVIRDPAGNLYGTTFNSGDLSKCAGSGCGVVFKLDRRGHETVLHSFEGGTTDGAFPAMDLFRDEAGNLYSTTHGGGHVEVSACSVNPGCGVVFKLDPTGKHTILYAFTGGADGLGPSSGVIQDREGNFYGTTIAGGDLNGVCPGPPLGECGVLFKLDPDGKETVLHAFTGGADGYGAYGDLLRDEHGNLYGTTSLGGDTSGFCGSTVYNADGKILGCGTVYKLDPNGRFTALHTFDGTEGRPYPDSWLVRDHEGNLYGMTGNGGNLKDCSGTAFTSTGSPIGCGVVFKVDRRGDESVLYSFTGGADGGETFASVVRDRAGDLYGATSYGGDLSGCGGFGCGVVFKLDRRGKETVLYTFTGGADGANPQGNLLLDKEGRLYGTTVGGGDMSCNPPNGCRVVFKIDLRHCGDYNTAQ